MSKQSQIQEIYINKGVEFFKTQKRGLYDLCMRFGKVRTSLELLKRICNSNCTILISYPNNKIKEEWEKQIIQWDYNNPNITFVNFSSIWKYKDKIFDVLIIDEPQEASDLERDECHLIMTNDPETITIALSGTMSEEMKGLWGIPTIAKYTTLDGIRDGIVSSYTVTVHLVDLDNTIKTPNSKGKLLTEKARYDNYSYVISKMQKDGKNSMHLALSRNRLSMSSIGKKTALLKLLNELKDKRVIIFCGISSVADSLGIPSYHSKSKDDSNFQAFQNKEFNHLALVESGKIGVSFIDLDCVIMLNWTGNEANTAQAVNRAIKLDYASKSADLRILCLREPPELKKIKESLSMLDKTKIKYI